jgi:hypothetical protein
MSNIAKNVPKTDTTKTVPIPSPVKAVDPKKVESIKPIAPIVEKNVAQAQV